MTKEAQIPFFFNPLKSRLLWIFCSVHLLVAVFLGEIFAFAPDEGGYLNIFKELYSRHFSLVGHLGWVATTPTLFVQVIYLPAKIFTLFGLPDYLALRILAIALSALSVYLLLCIARHQGSKKKYFSWALIAILLIPTTFLWMTLSLREEFLFLGFSTFSSGIYLLNLKRTRAAFITLTLGTFFVCYTKGYLFVLLFFAFITLLLVRGLMQRKFTISHGYIAIAVILPLVFAPATTKSLVSGVVGQLTGQSGALVISTDSAGQVVSTQGSTTTGALAAEVAANPDSLFSKFALKSKIVSTSTGSSTGSSTVTPAPDAKRVERLTLQPGHLRQPLTLISSSARFLFLPSPFIDNGSKFQNIGSFEEIIWWGLYIFLGFMIFRLIKSRRKIDDLFIWASAFSVFFIIFSAITEINVGTALRHRSILLIPILAMILMCQEPKKEALDVSDPA